MTKRIFRSIFLAAIGVFLASVGLFLGVLYHYFSDEQRGQLRMQTELAAKGAADEGVGYFEGLEAQDYRITWIAADGTVLYDSRSDYTEMENHLQREEIRRALETGTGESSRYSATLTERSLYCAKLLPDGTVLRMSVAQRTVLTLIIGMLQPLCAIFVVALILSLLLAMRLARKIVRPLNELNLEDPLSNRCYDELSPLLRRIHVQQRKIRQQGEELLQKQKEFEAVTEHMAEGIVLLNTEGMILGINRAALQLFGAEYSCVGQHILSVYRGVEISELLSQAKGGIHAGKVTGISGGRYQIDVSPVFSDGTVSGAVMLTQNVTEKEQAEQMRREFTANVSHELKTPLQTIAGCAELLENGMVQDADKQRFYLQIHAEAGRMIRLVEDIIRLSRLDEGADSMRREKVDLYALAKETVHSLTTAAQKAGVSLTLAGEPAVIEGIPQLLQSIVYNLCDNAVKYNRRGGAAAVTVKKADGGAVLSVADTGIGIPPEHRQRIFERFYRVDKSRSKELGGTGLGLSIVKHAARLHGAEIELRSAVDEGTTVTVAFPGPDKAEP